MSKIFIVLLFVTLAIAGCGPDQEPDANLLTSAEVIEFTLQTGIVDGGMVFLGTSAGIEGIVNPTLVVEPGQFVRLIVTNGDGLLHDLSIPELGLKSSPVDTKGSTSLVSFALDAGQEGIYTYFCTVLGHRQAGMEGSLVVGRDAKSVSSATTDRIE